MLDRGRQAATRHTDLTGHSAKMLWACAAMPDGLMWLLGRRNG